MSKVLRFKKEPNLSDFNGLIINEANFTLGKSMILGGKNNIVMKIPNTFRFPTNLEVVKTSEGNWEIIMTQFLTRGPEVWEMKDAFKRIGFRNPEIEKQMVALCIQLIDMDLAYWVD